MKYKAWLILLGIYLSITIPIGILLTQNRGADIKLCYAFVCYLLFSIIKNAIVAYLESTPASEASRRKIGEYDLKSDYYWLSSQGRHQEYKYLVINDNGNVEERKSRCIEAVPLEEGESPYVEEFEVTKEWKNPFALFVLKNNLFHSVVFHSTEVIKNEYSNNREGVLNDE